MYLKALKKTMFGIVAVITMYLIIVSIWASLSISYLLPAASIGSELSLLSLEQKNILLKIEDPTFYKHIGLDVSQG